MLITDILPAEAAQRIRSLAERHQQHRVDGGISLVASQNRISPEALSMLGTSFAAKFSSGERGARAHAGGTFLDDMEEIVEGLTARLFPGYSVEIRPPAGSIANESLLLALTAPGDTIVAPGNVAGGHASLSAGGFAGRIGLNVLELPFADGGITPDLDLLETMLASSRPKVVVIGTAKILHPYPVADIAALAAKHGATLVMDGAHVAGLIAGGAFPDPLAAGAKAYTGSTQKTFPGPVGGIIVCNELELYRTVRTVTRQRLDNYQNNRIAALGVVFAEMLAFGPELSAAMVDTARSLGAALAAEGLSIEGERFGYTRSHMVLVDTEGHDRNGELNRRLEAVGLFTTATTLWPKPGEAGQRTALRMGANDLARLDYDLDALQALAGLIADTVLNRRLPNAIAEDVRELADAHRQIVPAFRL